MEELDKRFSRFDNIQHIVPVSATEFQGVSHLMDLIREVASNMENIKVALPKIYQNLEDLIFEIKDKENPPAIDWERFKNLASKVNFKDDDQLLRATNFLNDLGSLVFFESDSHLPSDRLIVLDPQWLTAMFASIITTSHTLIKNGILKYSNLQFIWRPPQYPLSMHPQLLALFSKFEILFELPSQGDDRVFLIPSLLMEERPNEPLLPLLPIDTNLDSSPHSINQFTRIYELQFVPNGLFSRLMVRFLHFVTMPLRYWRGGVLADVNSDKASIELVKSSISIITRGDTAAETMRMIIEIVESLVQNFQVKVTKALVYCTHCIANRIDPPHLFDVKKCEQLGNYFALLRISFSEISFVLFSKISQEENSTKFAFAYIFILQ